MFLKVKDNEKLVRDSESSAVINTDRREYEALMTQKKRQQTLVEDINNLKEEVNDIKDLLQEILKRVG